MAATRSYTAPVVALSGLSIGFSSAILVSAVVSGLTAQQPTAPVEPRAVVAPRPASSPPRPADARDDLRGLPTRRGPDAQLPPLEGNALRDASALLRTQLGLMVGQVPQNKRLALRPEVLEARPQMVTRLLHQMLQIESVPLRKV